MRREFQRRVESMESIQGQRGGGVLLGFDGNKDVKRDGRPVRRIEDRRIHPDPRKIIEVKVDHTIDARGMYCPKPLMELIIAMKTVPVGAVIETLSSLRQSTKEIPYWASKLGHEYLGLEQKDGYWSILVRKTH
jgi:TusA-related sulfurtransferase